MVNKKIFVFVIGILIASLFLINFGSAVFWKVCVEQLDETSCNVLENPGPSTPQGSNSCLWTDYDCTDPQSTNPSCDVTFPEYTSPGCQEIDACGLNSAGCFLENQCITSTDLGSKSDPASNPEKIYTKTDSSFRGPGWFCDGCRLHDVSASGACDTCSDGILNGDETGVDCGGNYCGSCDVQGPASVYWTSDSSGNNKLTTPPNLKKSSSDNTLFLVLENPPQGYSWIFEIYEADTGPDDNIRIGASALSGSLTNGKIVARWDINENDIKKANFFGIAGSGVYDFYFKTSGISDVVPESPIAPSGQDAESSGPTGPAGAPPSSLILNLITGKAITGNQISQPPYQSEILMVDWNAGGAQTCQIQSAIWERSEVVEGEMVGLEVATTPACNGNYILFEVKKTNGASAENQPLIAKITNGQATGIWTAESSGNYEFTADVETLTSDTPMVSDELIVTPLSGLCSSVAICADYTTKEQCNLDQCSVADASTPGFCETPSCSWDSTTSKCNSICGSNLVGTCFYSDVGTDTCDDDGFLTMTLEAKWIWSPENNFGGTSQADCNSGQIFSDGACRNDLQGKQQECINSGGPQEPIACPLNVKLPIDSWTGIIGAILIIIGIYSIYWGIRGLRTIRKNKKRINKKSYK